MEDSFCIGSWEDNLELSVARTTVVINLSIVGVSFNWQTNRDVLNLSEGTITSYTIITAWSSIMIKSTLTIWIAGSLIADNTSIITIEVQIKINLCIPEKSNSQRSTCSTDTYKNRRNFRGIWNWWAWWDGPYEICVLVSNDFFQ